MKAKKYTKQQITEAIAFWKKILENKSPLLDSLVDEFGYGIVFNNVPLLFTLHTYEILFKHINRYLFSSKLTKWQFIKDDLECKKSDALCGYVNSLISNIEKQQYDVVLKDTIINGELYAAPHYAFSSDLVDGNSYLLPLAASLLCHEMIHQFNFECENEGSVEWLAYAYGKPYEKHGENFEKLMEKANNEHGLYIQKTGFGSFPELEHASLKHIKDFAGNDYKNESEANVVHGHKIIKHNEDYSAITQFL